MGVRSESDFILFRKQKKAEKINGIGSVEYLPVNLFGSVMGIAGLALAWRLSSQLFGTYSIIGELVGAVAVLVFVVLTVSYLVKLVKYPAKVMEEFRNPIVGNFFGTITIAILLLSSVIIPYNKPVGEAVWIVGLVLTVIVAYIIIARLIQIKQDVLHATPAWLIPGVGTLDVAVTGGTMPFAWSKEVNLFCFAIGGVLALVFFTLIFSRIMHHEAMPERLTPSLMIMIAPFAVGFLAYTSITQEIDMFASVLFYFGLFLFMVLFGKVFQRGLPFMVTWWAVSFPMAALSNAALKYAQYVDSWPMKAIAAIILAILTMVIIYIFVKTLVLLFKGQLLRG